MAQDVSNNFPPTDSLLQSGQCCSHRTQPKVARGPGLQVARVCLQPWKPAASLLAGCPCTQLAGLAGEGRG